VRRSAARKVAWLLPCPVRVAQSIGQAMCLAAAGARELAGKEQQRWPARFGWCHSPGDSEEYFPVSLRDTEDCNQRLCYLSGGLATTQLDHVYGRCRVSYPLSQIFLRHIERFASLPEPLPERLSIFHRKATVPTPFYSECIFCAVFVIPIIP